MNWLEALEMMDPGITSRGAPRIPKSIPGSEQVYLMTPAATDWAEAPGKITLPDGSQVAYKQDRDYSIKPGAYEKAKKGKIRLEDFITHPDLFKSYPQLKDLEVLVNPNLSALGDYAPKKFQDLLAHRPEGQRAPLRLKGGPGMQGVTLHELAHAIRDMTGIEIPVGSDHRRRALHELGKSGPVSKISESSISNKIMKDYWQALDEGLADAMDKMWQNSVPTGADPRNYMPSQNVWTPQDIRKLMPLR